MRNPLRGLLHQPRRRAIAIAIGVLVAVVVIAGLAAGYRILRVERDLRRARSLLDQAGTSVEQGNIADAERTLGQAQDLLVHTNNDLYGSTELDIVGWIPVVNQNLDSLRSSVGVALKLASGGDRILRSGQSLQGPSGKLEVALHGGTVPLATVQDVQREVDSLANGLPARADEPSSSLLVGPVHDLQSSVFHEADRRRAQLSNVARALSLLADMAGANGDRRYLIAVANTAEMRAAGGMVLSYGVLTSSGGTFTLGDFGGIDDLALPNPVDPKSVDLPADYLTRWTGLQPTQLWRNTTLAPDFRFDAPVMEAMYAAKTNTRVDGVIQVDPAGLAAILTGTGPINVPGVGTVSADNVVDLTLNRAYLDFPDRDQRQEVLGDVAKIAFKTLTSGTFDSLRPFGEALFKAAASRHLIFYANSGDAARAAASFDADGQLPAADQQDYAALTVQNFSKNKLDYYVDTSLSLSGQRAAAQVGHVAATITVANSAPANLASTYVTGPNGPDEQAGLYRAVVSLYVPNGARLDSVDGATKQPAALTSEAGRTLVTYQVDLPAGATSTVTLHLSLAPRPAEASYSFELVPIPRVRPTTAAVDLDLGGTNLRLATTPLDRRLVLR